MIVPPDGYSGSKGSIAANLINLTALHGSAAAIIGTGSVQYPPPRTAGVDWNALAAAVTATFEATGHWYLPASASGTPVPPPTDWNALAAQATANFESTGQWYL